MIKKIVKTQQSNNLLEATRLRSRVSGLIMLAIPYLGVALCMSVIGVTVVGSIFIYYWMQK